MLMVPADHRNTVAHKWIVRRFGTDCYECLWTEPSDSPAAVVHVPIAIRLLAELRRELRHEDVKPTRTNQRAVAEVDGATEAADQKRIAQLVDSYT